MILNQDGLIELGKRVALKMITQNRLKELLHYDPETGIFTWKVNTNSTKIGDICNTKSHGYLVIRVDSKQYSAHRLAWLYMTGKFPVEFLIDHKDGTRDNNKWENLREATRQQNRQNSKVKNNSILGVKGIAKTKRGYQARITIGTFKTLEEASKAYKKMAEIIHKEYIHVSLK
jgi:hypothetical protein